MLPVSSGGDQCSAVSDEELPDASGYSLDNNLLPWKSMEFAKQLRVVRGTRNEAIKHAINWVYSSGLFPEHTDYYAAGAWSVLAHGLIGTHDGIPTSDWIYEVPKNWNISKDENEERVNRAFLRFPASTGFIVSSKACWWVFDDPVHKELPNDTIMLFMELAETIAQWASTRKVLSLAGVKGLLEEYDVFKSGAQRLRIAPHLKPYFLHSPTCHSEVEALFNPDLLKLIKYWPQVDEVHSILDGLKAFSENGARYHFQSEFLTGQVRTPWKLERFQDKMFAICDVLNDPSVLEEESHRERLKAFSNDFLKGLISSRLDGRLEGFLTDLTPTVTDDVVKAITEQVNKMRMS